MGKKREIDYESVDRGSGNMPSSSKKHHKKHKKHKKKKIARNFERGVIDIISSNPVPTEKIKLPVAPKVLSTPSSTTTSSSTRSQQKKRRIKGKDSGTSSDEERWLDAIESGKLEEVDDELKKIKDPKLMTARQRAMYERSTEQSPGTEALMSLPIGYKEKVMTAEAIQKAQLKSQRRKQMADEKREKDKKKTMERLLKKQDSTKIGKQAKSRVARTSYPVISYKNTLEGTTISFPPGVEFPLKPQMLGDTPKSQLCGVPGCKNIKVYSCSKTNLPLCSFSCYRKNVTLIKDVIC